MTDCERTAILAAIDRQEHVLTEKCDQLREYAERARRGEIHVQHFANAITKLANEIATRKE